MGTSCGDSNWSQHFDTLTIVADASPDKMASAYSWTISGMLAGTTFGPFLGGFVSDIYGIKTAFLVSFILYVITSILAIIMRETGSRHKDFSPLPSKSLRTIWKVLVLFSIVNVIQGIAVGLSNPVLPIFITKRFNVDFTQLGLIYALASLPAILVQFPGGKIAEKYSKKRLIILSLIFSSPFNAFVAFSRNLTEIFLCLFIGNAIIYIASSAYQSLMMELTPDDRRGFMNGASMTASWIGTILGSALCGPIWDILGPNILYFIYTILLLVSSIPFFFLQKEEKKVETSIPLSGL